MSHSIRRRDFLSAGVAGAAALALGTKAFAADDNLYGPFHMGVQSYTFRGLKTLDEVLARVKELGLKNIEFYPGHMPMTNDAKKIAEYKEKLAAAGITAMAYGVHTFGEDPGQNRKMFEFAKEMNMYCVSSFFKPKAALSLDKLCDEFPDIHLGIHNHGSKDSYPTPDEVLECVKDRHKNIGSTADLGWFIVSKQDPIACIEKLKDRLFGIHFKDFTEKNQERIVGDGQLKVKETLAALKKADFKGCISLEYEHDKDGQDKLAEDVKTALTRVQAAVKEI